MNIQQFEDLCTLYGLTCQVIENHVSIHDDGRKTTAFVCKPYNGAYHGGWFYADVHSDEKIIEGVRDNAAAWAIPVPTWK